MINSLGLRHFALNVKNAQVSKNFYTQIFGMSIEWEPDAQNVYLTSSGQDNLALHQKENLRIDPVNQAMDHFGFIMASEADVNTAYQNVAAQKVEIVQLPKKHRDGAYSFYLKDPDGYVIQLIYHPRVVRTVTAKLG